jgi:hypothetical protein
MQPLQDDAHEAVFDDESEASRDETTENAEQ